MPRTLAEIAADRVKLTASSQALDVEEAGAVKPLLEEAAGILADADFAAKVERMAAIRDELPAGLARDQVGNVVIVHHGVSMVLRQELARGEALINQPLPGAEGEVTFDAFGAGGPQAGTGAEGGQQ